MYFHGETVYYDRVLINRLYKSGFHLINDYDLRRLYQMKLKLNKYINLSKQAKQRIKWFDYYRKCGNVAQVCRHFGLSRKTFYKWKQFYSPSNLFSLENRSTAPINPRKPEITLLQKQRVIRLRNKYICYSKIKLAKIYENLYNEEISSWKIQRVIQTFKLYPNPQKSAKITRKRLRAVKKKRITGLKKKKKAGFLLCLDTIEIRMQGVKRFVFTAIDNFSKIAFARMYKKASSYNATDFLNRLLYLVDGKIENIQTDNGSEFEKYFRKACEKQKLERYYSRPRTPKDNPVNERFNRTLQDEFLNFGNFRQEPMIFNRNLTEWLIEYNFVRPHQTLNYETPIKIAKVLPMYPSYTFSCQKPHLKL